MATGWRIVLTRSERRRLLVAAGVLSGIATGAAGRGALAALALATAAYVVIRIATVVKARS